MRLVWLGVVLAGCGAPEPERSELAPEPVREALPPSVAPPPPEPTLEPEGAGAARTPFASARVYKSLQDSHLEMFFCQMAALEANPDLTGQIEVRWTVASRSAKDVVVLRNTTGDRELAKCVAAKVHDWKFAAAEEGTVQNTWYFGRMKPGVDAQPIAGPEGAAQVVKANRGQLLWCYEQALRSHAGVVGVAGDLRMSWTLAGGEVTEARVDANTTGDEGLERCVLSKLRRWKFTGVEDGRATQTFVFEPKEPAAAP